MLWVLRNIGHELGGLADSFSGTATQRLRNTSSGTLMTASTQYDLVDHALGYILGKSGKGNKLPTPNAVIVTLSCKAHNFKV